MAADGLTLPKDVVLPANVAVAIYLPKQVREFRSVFRSASGFQTTDSVQLGNTFEETTLEMTSIRCTSALSRPPRAFPPLRSTR
jgi:hypothetical protein